MTDLARPSLKTVLRCGRLVMVPTGCSAGLGQRFSAAHVQSGSVVPGLNVRSAELDVWPTLKCTFPDRSAYRAVPTLWHPKIEADIAPCQTRRDSDGRRYRAVTD